MTADGIDRDDDPTVDGQPRWRQVSQRRYDPDGDGDLTAAIVRTVADADGSVGSEVTAPPLYDVIDVCAVERALLGHDARPDARQVAGTVEFRYREWLVRVRSDGWILVYEPGERSQC